MAPLERKGEKSTPRETNRKNERSNEKFFFSSKRFFHSYNKQ